MMEPISKELDTILEHAKDIYEKLERLHKNFNDTGQAKWKALLEVNSMVSTAALIVGKVSSRDFKEVVGRMFSDSQGDLILTYGIAGGDSTQVLTGDLLINEVKNQIQFIQECLV